MDQNVAVVTGANSGLGKVTATHLARAGWQVVLACRNPERGQRAVDEIRAATGSEALQLVQLDLASYDSVRAAAAAIDASVPRIDALVNNAGYLPGERQLAADGIELSFLVNHLSVFLFTRLLLDACRRAPAARIVSLSSEVHRLVKIPWDDLGFEQRYGPYYAYSVGKLGNVMFTHELARRLAAESGNKVTANAVHPGYIASEFGDDSHWYIRTGIKLVRPLLLTPEQGAQTQIHAATAPELEGVTGKYLKAKKIARPSRYSQIESECARLWEVSSALTGLEA
ncbi:MAG: SDR family oxidoreductase [Gammaproteobacteria bacterium]|nr:SDR family oxidoreductase [Gammaproteobacteria bacterium]